MFTRLRIHGSPLTPRHRPRVAAIGLALVLVFGGLLALLQPLPAHGLASSSHGVGHLWKGDNFSWIGSYRMDDGRLGFCLEAGRPSPIGNDYSTSLTTQVAGTTPEETARLAWIARTYAATTSRDDAAAAQLAVWTITGLNGHTQEYYAARANERAAFVLQRAKAILADADTKATMTASARMTLQLDERGTARITGDILTTVPGGSPTVLPSGQHAGSTKLVGATLPDGKTSGSVKNGEPVAITPDTSKPEMQVRADVTFTDLPFGREVYVGTSPSRSQGLLFSAGGRATVTAHDTKKALSPRPFQPRVETQTSAAQAKPGALLVDRLEVSVAQGPGLLPEWGRYRSGESLAPIPVTVTSRLLGPFEDPIAPAPAWPDEPPTVCTVATVFASGPAKATTPPCRVPAPGYYVWVETIDPADTPSDKGRDRVRPWKSPFGTASEVTFSPKSIAVQTRVRDEQLDAGSCAVDELDVSGFSQIAEGEHPEVDVESLLLGPFAEPVSDGRDLSDIDSLPLAGTAVTTVAADGDYDTPCIRVREAGHYVFVFRSDGSERDSAGHQLIPAFADFTAHAPEMFRVVEPVKPTPPVTPEASVPPAARPSKSAPPALAFTGSDGTPGLIALGGGVVSLGVLALAGRAVLRRRRGLVAETDPLGDSSPDRPAQS